MRDLLESIDELDELVSEVTERKKARPKKGQALSRALKLAYGSETGQGYDSWADIDDVMASEYRGRGMSSIEDAFNLETGPMEEELNFEE